MEIILLQDVKKVGKKGEVINVSDGYAKNFILPKKLGMVATKAAMNEIELKKKADDKKKQEELEKAKKLAEDIKDAKVIIKVKAGEGGRLFGSVTSKDIASAIKDQLKIKVDKKKLQLNDPIKSLGSTIVSVKLHPKVTAKVTVSVIEL